MTRRLIYAANWKMNHGPAAAQSLRPKLPELTAPVDGPRALVLPSGRLARGAWPSIPRAAGYHGRRAERALGAQGRVYRRDLRLPWRWRRAPGPSSSDTPSAATCSARPMTRWRARPSPRSRRDWYPLVCVGETLAEREGGRTEQVVLRQLTAVLDRVATEDWERIVLAYEPVWAIGTGKNATPDDAAQVHELIRFEASRRG